MIRLFTFLRPFSTMVSILLALLFLQSLATLYLPTLMADIIDTGVVKGDTDYIWRTGGFMLLVAAGSGICSILAALLSAITSTGFGRNLRSKDIIMNLGFHPSGMDSLGTPCWCFKTQQVFGPDGSTATKWDCGPGRACYEGLDEDE